MAHPRLIRCGVLFCSAALTALILPSCNSGALDDAPLGSAGASTSAGSSSFSAGSTSVSNAGAFGNPSAAGGASNDLAGSASGSGATSSSGGGAPGATGTPCTDTPPNNGDTCAHAVEYDWCSQAWLGDSCQNSCKKCTGGTGTGTGSASGGSSSSGGGATGSGGSVSSGPTIPPVTGGKDGWASRYWDCCKPACGWSSTACGKNGTSSDGGNSACQGGSAFMCYSFAPWAVSDTLSYGFAAAAGSNYSCGRCYQFTFTGEGSGSSSSIKGKSMVVQILNTGGDVAESQFDLLVPGGGVGMFNACSNQWGSSDLGAQYGGFALTCKNDKACIKTKCDTVFAGKPDLAAGCDWYLNWFGAADNPKFSYKEISCPAEIKQKSGH
ncbi:MAG: hypothetical protein ABIQ16_12135 [Polyangiaceae bacterium]